MFYRKILLSSVFVISIALPSNAYACGGCCGCFDWVKGFFRSSVSALVPTPTPPMPTGGAGASSSSPPSAHHMIEMRDVVQRPVPGLLIQRRPTSPTSPRVVVVRAPSPRGRLYAPEALLLQLATINVLLGQLNAIVGAYVGDPRLEQAARRAFVASEFHDLGNALNAVQVVDLIELDEMDGGNFDRIANIHAALGNAIQLREQSLVRLRQIDAGDPAPDLGVRTFSGYLGIISRDVRALQLDDASAENPENLAAIHAGLGEADAIMRVLGQWQTLEERLELEEVPMTLAELVFPVATSLRERAMSAGVTLTLPAQGDSMRLTFLGDLNMLRRVLRNFMNNAIKFTRSGGIVVVTTRMEVADGKVRLIVEVSDTGPGVAPEDRHRLFQPYSQINAQTLQGGGGNGLGLWVSRRIVEASGGTVYMRPRLGGGSIFGFEATFKLPTRRE